MALNVDYGPIGLFGAIAAQAGQNEGKWRQAGLDMQAARMTQENIQQSNQIAAQDRAHQLQAAMASKLATAQKMSPAAEHVSSYLEQSAQMKQDEQNRSKAQLDKLLSSGQISEQQYGQGMMGILSGSKGLMDKAVMPPDTTDPMQKPIFAAKLQMLRDQRTQAYSDLKNTNEAMLDPLKKGGVTPGQSDRLQQQIDQSYRDEQAILSQAATKTPTTAAAGSAQIFSPQGPGAPMQLGTGSVSFNPGTSSEHDIVNMARQMAGPNAAPIGMVGATTDTLQAPQAFPDGFTIKHPGTGEVRVMKDGQWQSLTGGQ